MFSPIFYELYHELAFEILLSIEDLTGILPLLSKELKVV